MPQRATPAPSPAGDSTVAANGRAQHAFPGFRPLDANYIYTPNQFFELCLPRHSRGCVRLVGYLLRRTLGWLDTSGRPVEQKIAVTWRELIDDAGISRGAIAKAVEEATAARFIKVVTRGRSKASGTSAQTARYELRWDDSGEWHGDPATFRGFYTGEGRRSPIPDSYFDTIVRGEPLATARVVGIVLRQTIGYQNQFGGRRQQAKLSFSELQRRCGIADRKTLSKSVHSALDSGYIRLAQAGTFDPNAGKTSAAAEYGVRWLNQDGPETPPAGEPLSVQETHRRVAACRFKNPTASTVQKPDRRRFKTATGVGSIAPLPPHKEEKTSPKDTHKQPAAAVEAMLREAGFDAKVVGTIARSASEDVVRRQVEWLPRRSATRNKLGLLRRAIAEDWAEPTAALEEATPAAEFARGFYAGLAGREATVAEPTATDLRAADRLLAALPPGKAWGETFGKHVRHERQTSPSPAAPPSLASATRTYGDRFVADRRARHEAASAKSEADRRAEHRRRHAATYHEYLLDRERELQAERPEDWRHFEEWRLRQRERYEAAPPSARDALLAAWAGEAQRHDDLIAFFRGEIDDFWVWDSGVNPHRLTA